MPQYRAAMTVSALRPLAEDKPARPLDPARLRAANINPATGLASDYLNHFNEAIMMLDLVTTMPDCIADLMAWRPMTYREHFAASSQKHRELALAAYEAAEPTARRRLDEIAAAMNALLIAAREAVRLTVSDPAAARLAREAASELKPLIARAGALINGMDAAGEDASAAVQAAVDALMER